LRKRVEELEDANGRLKKNIEVSKGVLKNYETTIEKLHTQIEEMRLKMQIQGTNQEE
jgi:hypothetical protein